MSNILDAIMNLVQSSDITLREIVPGENRINSIGEGLEDFVKDLFAGTLGVNDSAKRKQQLSECFSYLGNTTNPPDIILKNSDAIEVKKVNSSRSQIALNSSYPKAKLLSKSTLISKHCRECEREPWISKDMIYVVGIPVGKRVKILGMVYGEDYAADNAVYEKVEQTIKRGVDKVENVEHGETKELGRVNRVDPLGITYLRVRGMWHITNPFVVFEDIYKVKSEAEFNFMAIINKEKYNSFDNIEEFEELTKSTNLRIVDEKICDPNNPAKLKEIKLITYYI